MILNVISLYNTEYYEIYYKLFELLLNNKLQFI